MYVVESHLQLLYIEEIYLRNVPVILFYFQDERNQVLTTHIWLDQEWHDEKLTWDPKDFGGLETLRMPSHLLWKPDVVLYNR